MKSWNKKTLALILFSGAGAIIVFTPLKNLIFSEDLFASSEQIAARPASPSAQPQQLSPPPPPPPPPGGLPTLTPGPGLGSPRPHGDPHAIPVLTPISIPSPTYDGYNWHNNGRGDLRTPPSGYSWFIYYSNGQYYAIEIPDGATTISVGPNGSLVISYMGTDGHTHTITLQHASIVGQLQGGSGNNMTLYNFPQGTQMTFSQGGYITVHPGQGNATGRDQYLEPPGGQTESGPGPKSINKNPCPQVPCRESLPPSPPPPPPPGGNPGPGPGSGSGGSPGSGSGPGSATGDSGSGDSGGGPGPGCVDGTENTDDNCLDCNPAVT